jgi:hypothetical protein
VAITRQSRERSCGGNATAFGCSARVAGPALLEDAERRLEDALAGLDRDETALQPRGRGTDNDFKTGATTRRRGLAEADVEVPQLERRAVGLPTAISTVFGLIVATTVLVSVGQGFSASWIFLVALGIGLLAMYMQALSFSELATLMPKAGSMNEYVRAGLGAFAGSMTALVGYIAIIVFPAAAESLFPAIIITDFLGAAGDPKVWVAIIVVAVALLNVFGVRPFAAIEIPLTGIVALSLLAFGIIGVLGIGSEDPVGPALPSIGWDWSILTGLLGLAVFTFVGLEYVCPLAERPRRLLGVRHAVQHRGMPASSALSVETVAATEMRPIHHLPVSPSIAMATVMLVSAVGSPS